MFPKRRFDPGLLLFAVFCLALPSAFIWLHLVTPSDGARLRRNQQVMTPSGPVLEPYQPGQSLLQSGDVLLAVDGTSMLDWTQRLLDYSLVRPEWKYGDRVTYTVLRAGEQLDLTITLQRLPWRVILSEHWGVILAFLLIQALATFVYLQSPADPAARALFLWGFSASHTYTWAFSLQVSDLVGATGFWLYRLAATGLWLIFWGATGHLALVFPRSLFSGVRQRLLIGLSYLVAILIFIAYVSWRWVDSVNLLDWWNDSSFGEFLVAVCVMPMFIVLLIYQYWRSPSTVEKIKIRWVVFGGLTTGILAFTLYFLAYLVFDQPLLSPNALGLVTYPFPLALGIAIWRYQLFDIDLIIRRTLVYSILTALLSGLYFAGVILLQELVNVISGVEDSQAAVVVSTLSIAALFTPLRSRVQDVIDRRFYRRKYNAERALAEFAAAARVETDLEALSAQVVEIVQQTMQPEQVSLWLRSDSEERAGAPGAAE
ncbi:MAG TPA: hypothetical protein VJL34_02995 [Anaerolineales bacterium]|nr:hypothetical protein [Anaerolineales bacterium]